MQQLPAKITRNCPRCNGKVTLELQRGSNLQVEHIRQGRVKPWSMYSQVKLDVCYTDGDHVCEESE